MAMVFRRTDSSDGERLSDFLKERLPGPQAEASFAIPQLEWKYWAPRQDWPHSRSYVLQDEERIQAHCAILPASFAASDGPLNAVHFIDWASAPESFGAGVRVLRKIAAESEIDLLCAVGGSSHTRKILPLLKFAAAGEVLTMARPVRPLPQCRTHQYRNWKLPLRLVRNSLWVASSPAKPSAEWSFAPADPDSIPEELWNPPDAGAGRRRSAPLYAHYTRCPFMRFELFTITHAGEAVGCFLLGFARGQARIADLWLAKKTPECYKEGYLAALAAARADPTVAEVVSFASTEASQDALTRCGFQVCGRESIMVLPIDRAPPDSIDCQMIDTDNVFWNSENYQYLT